MSFRWILHKEFKNYIHLLKWMQMLRSTHYKMLGSMSLKNSPISPLSLEMISLCWISQISTWYTLLFLLNTLQLKKKNTTHSRQRDFKNNFTAILWYLFSDASRQDWISKCEFSGMTVCVVGVFPDFQSGVVMIWVSQMCLMQSRCFRKLNPAIMPF